MCCYFVETTARSRIWFWFAQCSEWTHHPSEGAQDYWTVPYQSGALCVCKGEFNLIIRVYAFA